MRDVGDGRDVIDLEARIGRAFEEEELGLRPDGRLPLREIGAVDQRRGDAETRQQIFDHIETGAEQRAGGDDMVAGLHLREQGAR